MFRFGRYRVDPDGLRIFRDDARLDAPQQTVEVLAYLIVHRDRIVSREELIDRFWPRAGTGADAAVNTCIRRIRLVLEDSADAPRYVQTRPRSGYRFVGILEIGRSPPRARRLAVAALAATLVAIPAAGWGLAQMGLGQPQRHSIAIESVRNLCEYTLFPRFNAGLRESLTAETAHRLPAGFELIDPARETDFRLRTSVRQTVRATSVTLTLVRAGDGAVIWSGEFTEPTDTDDYVPLQRALAQRMARSAGEALAARRDTLS